MKCLHDLGITSILFVLGVLIDIHARDEKVFHALIVSVLPSREVK
jgi:hypothetical protein